MTQHDEPQRPLTQGRRTAKSRRQITQIARTRSQTPFDATSAPLTALVHLCGNFLSRQLLFLEDIIGVQAKRCAASSQPRLPDWHQQPWTDGLAMSKMAKMLRTLRQAY